MKRKFTRRELAVMAAAGAAPASAQTPAPSGGEDLKAARDLNAHNIETLMKFEIPISTEPAFQFKA